MAVPSLVDHAIPSAYPRETRTRQKIVASFKVRRFRIIYQLGRKARTIRIFAVDHRREVYEELADRLRRVAPRK